MMKKYNTSSNNLKGDITLLCIYASFVLCFTVGIRNVGLHKPQYDIFWSYFKVLSGDWSILWQIVGNIVLFIPIGCLLSQKKRYLIIPILISCAIEILQFLTMRGQFEFDDIINNTLGAIIGWTIGRKIQKKYIVGLVGVLLLGGLCFISGNKIEKPNIPSLLCFQIDNNGDGFCFIPGIQRNYKLLLRNTATGKTKVVPAEIGIEKPEVADYFGKDYLYSGFSMNNVPADAEYEIQVEFNPLLIISTGVYVGSTGIHYVIDNSYRRPLIKENYIESGYLLFYKPEYNCWIYQYNGALYWITDDGFPFEEDGTTYIQFQLWTTQEEKLPVTRIENKRQWDNIGAYFEDYELQGDYGMYRIMKRELPNEYPITSIETGCYYHNIWVWKDFFRPHYEF